jgi:membrane protein required for colicin V production
MLFNWLDIILLVILAVTVVLGAIKGLLRQMVGLLAVVFGLILAVKYYSLGADLFAFLSNQVIADLLGFFIIFFGVLCIGWVVNRLFAKAVKGPLKSMNHFMGAGLGFLKGILICCIILLGFRVFPVNQEAVDESLLAPYGLKIAEGAYSLIPQSWKEKFNETKKKLEEKVERKEEMTEGIKSWGEIYDW